MGIMLDTTIDTTRVVISDIAPGVTRREREQAATRDLLHYLFGDNYELDHTPDGAPRLLVEGAPCHLSISHSRTRAAVAVDYERHIGIDVEEWRDQLVRVRDKYLTPEEVTEWGGTPNQLLLAWMAKEAAYKAFEPRGVTLLSVRLSVGAADNPPRAVFGLKQADLTFGEGFALAQVIP